MLRMGFDRIAQQALADLGVALLDGRKTKRIHQLGAFFLIGGNNRQHVFLLCAAGQNKVVLGGEQRVVLPDRVREETLGAAEIAACQLGIAPVVHHARGARGQANGGFVKAVGLLPVLVAVGDHRLKAVSLEGLMRGRDGIQNLVGAFPFVVADQRICIFDLVVIGGLFMRGHGFPGRHRLGAALGAHKRFGQAAPEIDPVRFFAGGALEIRDRLVGVGHIQHHVVEIAFIHDIDALESAINIGILGLSAARKGDGACHAQGNKDRSAHLLRPFTASASSRYSADQKVAAATPYQFIILFLSSSIIVFFRFCES